MAGNVTFTDAVAGATVAGGSFEAGDTINGGEGTDTLSVTVTGGGGTFTTGALPAALLTSVETLEVRSIMTQAADILTVDMANFASVTSFVNNLSTNAVTVTNLAATDTVTVNGNGAATNGAFSASYATAVTASTININGDTTGGTITVGATGGPIATQTINSTGGTNVLTGFASAATTTNVVINATTSLDLGTGIANFTNTSTNSIVVSGVAANTAAGVRAVDLGSATVNVNVDTINASGLTVGGIEAVLGASTTVVVTGGAGNDKITTGAALGTGSVAAGAGDADLLVVAREAHLTSSTLGAKYTGFEVLEVAFGANADAAVDLDNISGITSIRINQDTGTTGVTDLSAAQAAAVTIAGSGTGVVTIGVKNATTLGNVDTVTLAIDNGSSTVADLILTAPVMAGVENLVINAAADAVSVTALTGAPALTSVKINATHADTVTTEVVSGAIAWGANAHVDASGSSVGVVINNGAGTTSAIRITGGSGNDTITASTAVADVIDGGLGIDTINLGAGAAVSVDVQSTAILTANADLITGFTTLVEDFDYNGVLANGTGAAPTITAAEVASDTTIAAALATADASNDIVFIATTDLTDGTGTQETAMDAFVAGASATTAAAVVSAIVGTGGALNGAIANLDTVLGAADSALFQFSTNTDTFVFRITNTDATGNTLTSSEVTLVAAFGGTADLVAADYI